MALQQPFENASGVVVNYWRITGVNLSFEGKRGVLTFAGYLTEEARRSEKEQVCLRQITVKSELFDDYFSLPKLILNNVIAQEYAYAKEQDEFFKGAINLL